jgi:lipopolysaccharide export system permease protein
MRVLDRYIVKAICGSTILVMAVLLTLLALFLFINEQGWVGVGRYGNLQALRYVLLNLPATLAQFLPVAALIGSLLAMGNLARGSELTVMRAAGVSIWRISLSVLFAGLLLLPVAVAVGEYLAPPLTQLARVGKAVQRNADISVTSGSSAWIRQGNRILRADRLAGDAGVGGITVFELGSAHDLLSVGQAPAASVRSDGSWELRDFAASHFTPQRVASGTTALHRFSVADSPASLGAMASDPAELSLRELRRVISNLADNGQDARHYRFAYWSKLAGFMAIPLAVLLAVPFMFGALRMAEGGARAMLGLALGLGYFILQRMVASGTIAFGLDPLLLAWVPTLLLAAAVAVLMARLQRRGGRVSAA